MQFSRWKTLAVDVAVMGIVVCGYMLGERLLFRDARTLRAAATPIAAPAATAVAPAPFLPDFSGIARLYGPAVVNVSASGTVRTLRDAARSGQLEPDDPRGELLRRHLRRAPLDSPVYGIGAGFIVRSDGTILTNAHVVTGADRVRVKLGDGRELPAKVLGADEPTDVAVLKVDASDLPTVEIGDPQTTEVGAWVVAIGSPYGLENSVTSGVVSGKARFLPARDDIPFLQTDVPVNPGNSGGPLFDASGRVIGMNSVILTTSSSGGYQGLSFAVPIDVAMKVEEELVERGKVTRGRLGVAAQDLDQDLAGAFGLARPSGALVSSVDRGGPAARAGLEAGDVILALDGEAVASASELGPLISGLRPGGTAHLQVWRNGERRDVTAVVAERPGPRPAATVARPRRARAVLGVAVRPLRPAEKTRADVDAGLLVLRASGAAVRAGIVPGDVILAVNSTRVVTAAQLRAIVRCASHPVAVLIQRGQARAFVSVEIG